VSLKNKVVIVTGGAGFIGSHLVDRIIPESPEKIIVIDNYFLGLNDNLSAALEQQIPIELHTKDMTNFEIILELFREEHPDVVFDLAVIPLPVSLIHPRLTYRQNINMGLNICEIARLDLFSTLVHFSSSEAYGTCIESPMSENHPLNGKTTYAASKSAIDQLILSYQHTFGIKSTIIRPFNVYGPRQNIKSYAAVVPITIRRITSGKPPIICGDGLQTRDYTHVGDITRAAIDMYNQFGKTNGKVLNIASGVETTIETLIQMISKQMNYNGQIKYTDERIGDVRRHIADISLAKELIGYTPKIGLSEGITQTIGWYRNHAK
jgi:UDP-glucose 4-epimerase